MAMPEWELMELIRQRGETIQWRTHNEVRTDRHIYVKTRDWGGGELGWITWAAHDAEEGTWAFLHRLVRKLRSFFSKRREST